MKKVYNFIFLALISTVLFPCIVNAADLGQGPNVCNISNPYYDSDALVPVISNSSATEHGLIYDIVNVGMVDDTLYLYGWVFNKKIDTTLDGSNAKVDFVLRPKDGNGEDIPFEVDYASPSNASCWGNGCGGTGGAPKYYNLTYWNCYRTSQGTSSYIESAGGTYSTGGYCQAGKINTPVLKGGFRAKIDLSSGKIQPNTQYIVKMKFTHSASDKKIQDWQDVAAAKAVAFDSVFDYEGTDNMKVSISGFSDTASVVLGSGRPIGPSGLYCDSSVAKAKGITLAARTNYQQTSGFPIQDERGATQFGCRGGNPNCPGGGLGAGSIRLYRIYYNLEIKNGKGTAKPAKSAGGTSDLVPASWLKFGGNITISTGAGDVEVPEIPDPKECDGDIYYFYYFFLAGVSDEYNGRMVTSAKGANFNDKEILQQLGFQSNATISKEGGIYPITKDRLDWYYDKLKMATSSSRRWANEGNKYYIAYNSWCRTDENGNEISCYDAITGCEIDKNGNNIGECNPTEISDGSFNKQEYIKATVNVDVPTDKQQPLVISPQDAEGGLGYRFGISRYFKSYPSGRPSMMSSSVKAIHTRSQDHNLHPAVYQLSICPTKNAVDCSDSVSSAECLDGDQGTEMIFKENDDKTTCTLEHGTESGFTIIEKDETDSYCTVACKEDLRGELPTAKETAAGQYFLLDNYVPKIEAKRTCVTSEIKKYSEFDRELKDIEKTLMTQFNTWKDWVKINGPMDGSGYKSGLSTISEPVLIASGICTQPKFEVIDGELTYVGDEQVGKYEKYKWTINASAGPNSSSSALGGASYGGTEGEYTVLVEGSPGTSPECMPTPDTSKQTYDAEITAQMQQAEQTYKSSLDTYVKKINTYNLCFNWTDNTSNVSVSGRYTVNTHPDTTYRDEYAYSFEPTVSFYYPDRDGAIFPVSYTYKYNTRDVDKEGFDTSNVYWPEGTAIDNMYEQGGQKTTGLQNRGQNKEDRTILNCEGDTCTEGSTKNSYFYSSAYIRRDEEVKYTYHLPDVFTSVPSGRVMTTPQGTYLPLDPEAVPVNINTPAGTEEYKITVKDLKDKLRLSKEPQNPDDKFEERFIEEKALNAGEDYVCTYDVVNDIYLPGPKRFNFFYRVVDTYDINPLGRTLGYNWNDGRGDQVQDIIREDAMNYQTLTNSPDRDKFQYTLTPPAMQEIRKYNAKQNISDDGYADWDLHCDDYPKGGYHCYSNFLTCLASGEDYRGEEGHGFTSCSEIFKNSLSNYSKISNYNREDLRANRQLIIQKQNTLDCSSGISEAC